MSDSSSKEFKSAAQIRQSFIDFFIEKGHEFVPSSPVVIADDPTLLFANAGMNQFKANFLGEASNNYKRVVNSQKCLRVSGKHNDLDDVGRDATHQTLFEMLGCWSFGDYYKKEIITWAWELLTEIWKLDKERLFVSVFIDDDEAYDLWLSETDIEKWQILKFDAKENFWEMGAVGPCGPCVEIHYDKGPQATRKNCYKDVSCGVNGDDGRFVEIWNLVFMQNQRLEDSSIIDLPSKHIDTGMGFERICAILQGVESNYETDLFKPIIQKIAEISQVKYSNDLTGMPHRVIADHVRCLAFCIADGVTPSNEGRGYVLRRILRRACKYSSELGQKEPFLFKIVEIIVATIGDFYPELKARQKFIVDIIKDEEERFLKTLQTGLVHFSKIIKKTKKQNLTMISGADVFLLKDTYGFPEDLTEILATENNLKCDLIGFKECLEEQRERARQAQKFDTNLASSDAWQVFKKADSEFIGYEHLEASVKVTKMLEVAQNEYLICLDKSPFYPESGGQIGDTGTLQLADSSISFKVIDSFKLLNQHMHRVELVSGDVKLISAKDIFSAKVDSKRRNLIKRNHSATHLLQSALKNVVGDNVEQQGSYVSDISLRFDFTSSKALTKAELDQVEYLVNSYIVANQEIVTNVKDIELAKKEGAIALFGEKYDQLVRTVKMGVFSYELCGGTHASATGDIGLVKIISESSISSGVRRIEAVTGLEALRAFQEQTWLIKDLAKSLKSPSDSIQDKVTSLQASNKELERVNKTLEKQELLNKVTQMLRGAKLNSKGVKILAQEISAKEIPRTKHQLFLETLTDKLDDALAIVFVSDTNKNDLAILVATGAKIRDQYKANSIINDLKVIANGSGGGRPDRAQAGSKDLSTIPKLKEYCAALMK